MPDYNAPIRKLPATQRARALVTVARDSVNSFWLGRSWTEVGWSAWQGAKSTLAFVGTVGLKAAIALPTSYLGVNDLAKFAIGREATELAGDIAARSIDAVWGQVVDVLKGSLESGANGLVTPSPVESTATAQAQKAFREKRPEEALAALGRDTAELAIRLATFKKYSTKASQGGLAYCDEVHYLAQEVELIKGLRASVRTNAAKIVDLVEEIDKMVKAVDTSAMEDAVGKAADVVVASTTISHKNHYDFNVYKAVKSCSKQHCFGPGI